MKKCILCGHDENHPYTHYQDGKLHDLCIGSVHKGHLMPELEKEYNKRRKAYKAFFKKLPE